MKDLEMIKTHIKLLEERCGIKQEGVRPYDIALDNIEKELKALEILKNSWCCLIKKDDEIINEVRIELKTPLTQEEYDLLKEVLK